MGSISRGRDEAGSRAGDARAVGASEMDESTLCSDGEIARAVFCDHREIPPSITKTPIKKV